MAQLFPVRSVNEQAEARNTSNLEIAFGRSWRFDFDRGEFAITPTGRIAISEDKEAWVEWCEKTVRTRRYMHPIYSRSYGQELEELIGARFTRPAMESEIRRMVTEALLTDLRTADVGLFSFEWLTDRCFFSCEIRSVRDDTVSFRGEVMV